MLKNKRKTPIFFEDCSRIISGVLITAVVRTMPELLIQAYVHTRRMEYSRSSRTTHAQNSKASQQKKRRENKRHKKPDVLS